jgi:Ethanolamine ammonia lyase large subunit (EutB)
MLNYQSTSFHDALFVRRLLGLKRAPEFEAWLQRMGVTDGDGQVLPPPERPALADAMARLLDSSGGPSAGPLPSRPAIPSGDRPTYSSDEGPS